MRRRTTGVLGILLKGPTHTLTRTLSSSTGAASQKAPGTYGEELKCMVSRNELEGQLSPGRVLAEAIVPFLTPPITKTAIGHYI